MRKAVLVLGILATFAGALCAQGIPAQTTGEWANKLFPLTRDKDFEVVPRGAQLKFTFPMKNIYKVPLEITNLRPGCGCLTANATKKVLQPGEEGSIEVVMNTRIFSGPKTVTLRVTVGPQYISTATLTVTATARQDVVVNPGEINFGIINRGLPIKQSVDVEYSGGVEWRVLEVIKNSTAPFTVTIDEFKRTSSKQLLRKVNEVGYRLYAAVKPDAQPGPFREDLILKTNDPANPIFTVTVEGNVQAAIALSPSLVAVGYVKVGDEIERRVVVRGNRAFRITKIDGLGADISTDIPERSATTHVLTLRCRANSAGELKKTLTIHTDLDSESATVTVEATVQTPAVTVPQP